MSTRQIALPPLQLPFDRRLNPHAKQAWDYTLGWVKKYGLLPEKALPYLYTLDHYLLAAYAFPEANMEQLCLINECLMAFWLFDKQWDDAPPESIEVMQAPMLDALWGRPCQYGEPKGLDAALRDMRARMLKYSTEAWMQRFCNSLEAYFKACVWEVHNKSRHEVPDLESYIKMREDTGAVQPSFELAGVLGLTAMEPHLLEDEKIKRLSVLANHEITLFNDIISLEKEMKAGDMHNLVFIVQTKQSCSLPEAMARTGKMHDDEVQEFLRLEHEVMQDRARYPGVESYIDVLRCWMRANMDWSLMSERYQAPPAA